MEHRSREEDPALRRGMAQGVRGRPAVRGRDARQHVRPRHRVAGARLGQSCSHVHSRRRSRRELRPRARRRSRGAAHCLLVPHTVGRRGPGSRRVPEPRDTATRSRSSRHDGDSRQPDRPVHRAEERGGRAASRPDGADSRRACRDARRDDNIHRARDQSAARRRGEQCQRLHALALGAEPGRGPTIRRARDRRRPPCQ